MSKVKVSICVITYNHQTYIRECLSGLLMQKSSYDYEIIIGEDMSTDSTREICSEYVNEFPSIVKLIPRQSNVGMVANVIETLSFCDGKYVAFCEGDDYWTSQLKLQKQIDFLEANPEYVMCFHAVEVKNEVNSVKSREYSYPIPPQKDLTFKDIFSKHYIPTCSLVVRNDVIPRNWPKWIFSCAMMDLPLELIAASKGKTRYLDEKMGVYRRNENSITQSLKQRRAGRKSYIHLYRNLNGYLRYKYLDVFLLKLIRLRLGYVKDFLGLNPLLKEK